jgi:Ca-activated chloride channel family protein
VSRSLVVVVIAILASASPRAQSPTVSLSAVATSAPSAPTFRSGVDLVSLTVTVTDPKQQLVRGLTASDFSVLEDGVRQKVTFFGADDVPIDLAVMIDCSASMDEKLLDVQSAASGLVRSLRAADRAELISFRDTMGVAQAMTGDHDGVVRAIESLRADGNTSLYTALYVTLRELASDTSASVRRRAIVLLSDGEDTRSLIGLDEVLDLARRSGVSIYTVALSSSAERTWKKRDFAEGNFAMRSLAEATGARAFFPSGLRDVHKVYDSIAAELGSQYSLGYLPTRAIGDGAWRHVAVQLTARGDVSARSRPGYYASPGLAAVAMSLKQ